MDTKVKRCLCPNRRRAVRSDEVQPEQVCERCNHRIFVDKEDLENILQEPRLKGAEGTLERKEEEYITPIDQLVEQVEGALEPKESGTEAIYQEIIEIFNDLTFNDFSDLKSDSEGGKVKKPLVEKEGQNLFTYPTGVTENPELNHQAEGGEKTPRVSPILFDGKTPPFLRKFSHVYDRPEILHARRNLNVSGSYLFDDKNNILLGNWRGREPKDSFEPDDTSVREFNEHLDANQQVQLGLKILAPDSQISEQSGQTIGSEVAPRDPVSTSVNETNQLGESIEHAMAANDIKAYTSLGKFLGESKEDVEKYFRKVERFQLQAGWPEDKKAGMVPFGLEGKALDFYETCPVAIRADYNQLRAAIIAHFKSNKSEILRWEELSKTKQKPAQSVANFYDDIRKKADKIQGVTERNLLMIFMGGLQNPLKNKVAAYEPQNLREALEKARLIESIETTDEKESWAIQGTSSALDTNDLKELLHQLFEKKSVTHAPTPVQTRIEELCELTLKLKMKLEEQEKEI